MPHFLALHKKGVPMVVVRVCSEDPVVASSCRSRHRTKVRRYYTRQELQSQTKCEGYAKSAKKIVSGRGNLSRNDCNLLTLFKLHRFRQVDKNFVASEFGSEA